MQVNGGIGDQCGAEQTQFKWELRLSLTFLVPITIIKNNHVDIRLKTLHVYTKGTPSKSLILLMISHLSF